MNMNAEILLAAQSRQTVLDTLDIKIESAEKDLVVLSMPVTEKVHQYTGILHGGVSVVLAETAAAIGSAFNVDLEHFTPVGIEINANHVRSISRGSVMARAQPIYVGRQLSVWSIEITDDRGRLVSTARCTMMHKPGRALPPTE
jgi:1,4-dihydroxy-2-naphthoyl-CoA hydrolase